MNLSDLKAKASTLLSSATSKVGSAATAAKADVLIALRTVKAIALVNLSERATQATVYTLLGALGIVVATYAVKFDQAGKHEQALAAAVPTMAMQIYFASCMKSVIELNGAAEVQDVSTLAITKNELQQYCAQRAREIYQDLGGKEQDGQ